MIYSLISMPQKFLFLAISSKVNHNFCLRLIETHTQCIYKIIRVGTTVCNAMSIDKTFQSFMWMVAANTTVSHMQKVALEFG